MTYTSHIVLPCREELLLFDGIVKFIMHMSIVQRGKKKYLKKKITEEKKNYAKMQNATCNMLKKKEANPLLSASLHWLSFPVVL